MRTLPENSNQRYWNYSTSSTISKGNKTTLLLLFILGLASMLNFAYWWFNIEHISNIYLFGILSFILWFSLLRTLILWYIYLRIKKPQQKCAPKGLSVAIFTTSYKGEPIEMVRKTLEACRNIEYPHTTYLLDNTENPEFRKAAEENGAVWLELLNIPGAKAGKVNKALSVTDEEFVLILDPDHIPFPNFLDNTLGYFTDPEVGFVQVAQNYYNQEQSFIAKAAAEQTYTFYSANQMGYHGIGSAVAIGANCTFRRAALNSIGGHVQGLAEDLQTSIKLHAKGWKSVYNPVVVSRGLVPEDFGSFCKQQLKWAVGAVDVLFTDLPNAFKKINFHQKLTYLNISTYYLSGISTLFLMLLPFLYFTTGLMPVNMDIGELIINGGWILMTSLLYYTYMQKWMCHPQSERGLHWRAMVLKFATWPVFLLGSALTLTKNKIPYIPTAKRASKGLSAFAVPLIVYTLIFIISIIALAYHRNTNMELGDKAFSLPGTIIMIILGGMVFLASLLSVVLIKSNALNKTQDPWDEVELSKINRKNTNNQQTLNN